MTDHKNHTETIRVQTIVKANASKVWEYWSQPAHLENWNHAARREAAKEPSMGAVPKSKEEQLERKPAVVNFDFSGRYEVVSPENYVEYILGDGRKLKVLFGNVAEGVHIQLSIDAEHSHGVSIQKEGWQSLLDSFRRYVESRTDHP